MILENLSPEGVFALLKWLIVLGVWVLLVFGLYEDSARIRRMEDSSYITELLHVLHRRNIYIFGLVSMILVVVIADDARHIMEK